MRDVDIGILTPQRLESPRKGEEFLRLLASRFPSLLPQRYGNTEPLDLRFSSIPEAAKAWRDPFLWKSAGVEGNVWFGKGLRHTALYLSVSSQSRAAKEALAFVSYMSPLLLADFAYANVFIERGVDSKDTDVTVMPFRRGITTHDLRRGIPDLPWATVFGPAYTRLLGAERLRSLHAPVVRQLSGETFYIQLSETIEDLQSSYERVDAVRLAVKAELNGTVFCNPNAHESTECRAPSFQFPNEAGREGVEQSRLS